jgi:hypothetical protein
MRLTGDVTDMMQVVQVVRPRRDGRMVTDGRRPVRLALPDPDEAILSRRRSGRPGRSQ